MQPSRADVLVQGDGPRSAVKCEDLLCTIEMWVNYTDLKLASWPFVFLCYRTSRTVHFLVSCLGCQEHGATDCGTLRTAKPMGIYSRE